jgi:DNA repair protein RadC
VSQTPKISGFLAGKERAFEKLDGLSLGTVNKGKDYAPPLPNMNIRDMDYFASLLAYAGEPEDVALRLLERYQTIEGVLTAKSDELIQMSSEKCTFLIKNLAFVTSRRTTELFEPGVKYTPAQIAEYLKALYIGVSVEQAYLLTFDENGGYIDCTLIGEGTVNSSELLPRKAIEIAVSKSAHSVAIAHNHPFGNPSPSADDLKSTNQLERLFKSCEIGFTCHYIIAGQRCEMVMGNMDLSENEECLKEM